MVAHKLFSDKKPHTRGEVISAIFNFVSPELLIRERMYQVNRMKNRRSIRRDIGFYKPKDVDNETQKLIGARLCAGFILIICRRRKNIKQISKGYPNRIDDVFIINEDVPWNPKYSI